MTIEQITSLKISHVRDYNPDTGVSLVMIFAGTEAQMNSVAEYYEQEGQGAPIGYGYKTTFNKTAAGVVLTVRIPDEILYVTRWNLETEITQLPIFWDEKVRNYIPALAGLDLSESTGANLRAFMWRVGMIQRGAVALSSGQLASTVYENSSPPSPTANLGAMTVSEFKVMLQIVREGPYVDWHRPVLKRNRTIPVGYASVRTRLIGRPQLYTLDGIYNLFGLTDDIFDQANTVYADIPADVFPDTKWSWKLRRDDSDTVVGSGKVVECKDWVFGRWSTITNTFIS